MKQAENNPAVKTPSITSWSVVESGQTLRFASVYGVDRSCFWGCPLAMAHHPEPDLEPFGGLYNATASLELHEA